MKYTQVLNELEYMHTLAAIKKMKNLFLITSLILVSCETFRNNSSEVILENGLGTIEFTLPIKYNSFQRTFKNSDCGCCCDQIWNIYYCSSKDELPKQDTLPYFTGIDYRTTPGYRLTISQPSCSDCFGDVGVNIQEHLEKTIKMLKDENPDRELMDYDIMKINDQLFMVISLRDTISGFIHEEVRATTYLNGGPLDLTFYRHGTNSFDFIDESIEVLKTICIK